MKRIAAAGWSLLVLLSLPFATSAQAPTGAEGQNPLAKAPDEVQVVTVADGAEPRRLLRYKPAVGAVMRCAMTMNIDMSIEVDGRAMPQTRTPPIVMVMEIAVKEVAASGDIRIDMKVVKVDAEATEGVPEETVRSVREAMTGMAGITGVAAVSDRGQVRSADFTIPKDVSPMIRQTMDGMKQSIRQLCTPLPEKPVGVGANWTVTSHPTVNGVAATQSMSFTLTKLSEKGFEAEVTADQKADHQMVNSPLMPAGSTMELMSLTTRTTGHVFTPFDAVMPERSTVNADMHMDAVISQGDQKAKMKQRMVMKISVKPADAGPGAPAQ